MSADERDAADAVYVLEALAKVLRLNTGATDGDFAREHAEYMEDIAGAVARDANLEAGALADGRSYSGDEWLRSLIVVLYPGAEVEEIYSRIRSSH